MSEPDAVPLPREGEVFFDVRGEARSMRLSWYANSKVAVFSIWQGNRCTGTFRLPFADLTRMVQALQAGPPIGVPAGPPSAGGYREPDYGQDHDFVATSSYGQPMPADAGYANTTAYYSGQDYADPGYQEPEYQEPEYQEPAYREPDYGGWVEQAYGDSGADADQPYGDHPYGQHGYPGDYSADPGYGRAGRHSAPDHAAPAPDHGAPAPDHRVTRSDRLPPSARANYVMPDYDPPAQSPHSQRTQPDLVRTQHAWSESGWSEEPAQPDPLRSRDAESVPDPAMMSFPSVPARNGPSGYR